ncbi:hypothetical protein PAHAL_5G388500 [Panicum hallii]|uniref:Uncharacterized protein n=1 Tax=Panicum hallii TaxID=206008 RepID=A0A2S3HVQ4_9POAL|nr:hypothetical protein PAHAL_5G388500 [Panicum hallii]
MDLQMLAISYLLDCNPRLRLHNKIRQHKTKLIVGTKKFNALAKVNITESRWQCKGPGDEEEVYFGVRLDLGLIYLYVKLLPESRALCRLICLCLALEDAISKMLDDKVDALDK